MTITTVKPQANLIKTDVVARKEMSEWADVCEQLGINVTTSRLAAKSDVVISALQELEMPIFNYDEVETWLSSKAREMGSSVWGWMPLRNKDRLQFHWGSKDGDGLAPWREGAYLGKSRNRKFYHLPIPVETLRLTRALDCKLNGNPGRFNFIKCAQPYSFLVSSFLDANENAKPDPFIAVIARRISENNSRRQDYNYIKNNIFIFDMWDEPGFKKGGASGSYTALTE